MKHRLFIAVDLPETTKQEIVVLQHKLESLKLPIDWEPKEKLHLTLNFLGRLEDEEFSPVQSALSKAAQSFRNFELQPAFLETLYQRHDQSLIYLGIGGGVDELNQVYKQFASILNSLKNPQAQRYLPHITIGRMQKVDPTSVKAYLDKIEGCEFSPLSSFVVDHFTYYESFVSRLGSTYQRAGRIVLE